MLSEPSVAISSASPSSKSPSLKRSSSSATESETVCSSARGEDDQQRKEDGDDDSEIVLRQHKRRHSDWSVGPCLTFGEELKAARLDKTQTELSLENFIERSTRHDVLQLRDLILREDRTWESVTLIDRAYASNFRRWAYKKECVCHHIEKVCQRRGINLDIQVHLELDVDDLPLSVVLALLHEIKKHPEILNLTVVGHLNSSQVEAVMEAVMSLVDNLQEDRSWQAVNVYIGHVCGESDSDDDYEAWRAVMQNAMMSFSELYSQHGLPIDIRPSVRS